MIFGKIRNVMTDKRGLVLSLFVETEGSVEPFEVKNQIAEFCNSSHRERIFIGERYGRLMLVVSTDEGSSAFYRNLITSTLYSPKEVSMENLCNQIANTILEGGDVLSREILIGNGQVATISSLPDAPPQITFLSEGCYELNNFLLAATENATVSHCWDSKDVNFAEATYRLLEEVPCFPSPIGAVIHAYQNGDELLCQKTLCGKKRKALALKPKYPVNAFNMFAKIQRESIKKEYSSFKMSNNELNQLIGKLWKEMALDKKRPFLQLAESDKMRYQEEMKNSYGKKPLSDYNYFVQQEKQYVSATFSKQGSVAATGKHAGERWNAMTAEEKHLYELLRLVDEEEYGKQFLIKG